MPEFRELERKVFSALKEHWYDGFDSIIVRENKLNSLSSECLRLANVVSEDDFVRVISYKEEIDRQKSLLEEIKIASQEVVSNPFSINVALR